MRSCSLTGAVHHLASPFSHSCTYIRSVLWHRGFHRRGIIHVSFSSDGQLLAAVGMDVYHSVSVYRWAVKEVLFTSHVDKVGQPSLRLSSSSTPNLCLVSQGRCLACSFGNGLSVAIGGDSYLYFWR